MDISEKFQNWSPVRVYWREQKPFVDWCYMGGNRFTHSFFDLTVERQFELPFNLLFRHQTPLEFLGELDEQNPGLAPNGFIFHMSRCGSTLVAQMLAALEQNIVISEPSLIDSVLHTYAKSESITDRQRVDWLRWIVSALGRARGREKYYFIKFDSWSMLDLNFIRRAFPEVPWIFLYRNPIEVMVSQLRERGSQMIPGTIEKILPGMDFPQAIQMPSEEYIARVLARFCESAIEAGKTNNALLVNYNQLPEAIAAILEHFRVVYSPEDIKRVRQAAQFNAKTPSMLFASDSEAKRKQASETVVAACDKWLNPLYERLEKMRSEL